MYDFEEEEVPEPVCYSEDWNRLYLLLCTRQHEQAIELMKEMVETVTGRIIP
jgi:hypothetical protein